MLFRSEEEEEEEEEEFSRFSLVAAGEGKEIGLLCVHLVVTQEIVVSCGESVSKQRAVIRSLGP